MRWPVLPLFEVLRNGSCACGDTTRHAFGKHPRVTRGVLAANSGHEQVLTWWHRWRMANIGIATGQGSGLIVLDVDPRNGGDDGLVDLERTVGKLPETATVNTGGGGLHFYFRHPGVRPVRNASAFGGFPGLDLKADGGYVVAPPSNHQSGNTYLWDAVLHITETPPAPCPAAMLEILDCRSESRPLEYEEANWDGELSPQVMRLIARSNPIRARYKRSAEGLADASTSGVDYSLACQLARSGAAGRDIDHALRASRRRAMLKDKHPRYIPHTVGKALAWAREQKHGK